MIRLNIYIIYSEELENRHGTINSSINLIKSICVEKNMEVSINIISEPSKDYVNKCINSFNTRVNYDKFTENTIYNDLITPLNVNQISNFEKHRYIYKYILDNFKSTDVNDIHLIMEDDIIILNDYINNIKELIDDLKTLDVDDLNKWDFLFTCLNVSNNPARYVDINELYNIIISKSCYIIRNRDICEELYNNTNIFKLNLKLTLSKIIKDKKYKALSFNKITFVEGSKLGVYTTSVNYNNYLYLNNNYIALKKLSEKANLTDDDITNAEKIYNDSLNIPSVDIQNIMGVIYYNFKDYKKAKEYMCLSLNNLKDVRDILL